MRDKRQKTVTLSIEQQEYLKANYGKISITSLAKMLGLKYNKTLNNLIVMGVHKETDVTQQPIDMCKVVNFNKCFDVDKFGKYYDY